jgi:ABC-type transport system involved in multi-copper enzyme maturation permease subunit
MSLQTGVQSSRGPVSQRLVDRARYRVDRLKTEPNPIWIRELKQSARLGRTPIILMVLCVMITLIIASIGGVLSTTQSPAMIGVVLFQVFFSVAYFVVVLIGPAVAANSIASEREGRTWEAILLTGMRPGEVARGKFMAAYTTIGMYIVMLAPVGALPFLFGGVTAVETVVAFFFLFLIAVLAVAFGLAISSKMASLRAAIVVTLLLAFPLSGWAFGVFGSGLSLAAHRLWPSIPEGPPIWLPSAFVRAPFGIEYVAFLIAMPLGAVAVPAWFLYEATIASLTSVTDDRSSGLKRWFAAATPVCVATACALLFAVDDHDVDDAAIGALSALVVYLSFCVYLFAGDPIGPSRRVREMWRRAGAGRFRRFLGPGVMRSAMLLLGATLLALAATTVAALIRLEQVSAAGVGSATSTIVVTDDRQKVLVFAGYCIGFMVFVVGFIAWVRSRVVTALAARLIAFATLFGIAVGPWIVAAIAGVITEKTGLEGAAMLGAPSPFYAFMMVGVVGDGGNEIRILGAGYFASVLWALFGLLALSLAAQRTRGIIRRHEEALDAADRMLAEEDAAHARAAAEAAQPPAQPAAEPAS